MKTIGLTFPRGRTTKDSKDKEKVIKETEDKEKTTVEPKGENNEVQE